MPGVPAHAHEPAAAWDVVDSAASQPGGTAAPGFRTVGSWEVISGTPGAMPETNIEEPDLAPELRHQRLQNLLSYAGLVSALIMLLIGVLLMLANRPL